QHRGQVPGQVGVPGVGVPQVRAAHRGGHGQVGGDRGQRLVGPGQQVPGLVGHGPGPVPALAVHGHVDQPGQLPGQVGDVHPRAAVHLGRVLAGEQGHPELVCAGRRRGTAGHGHTVTFWLLPTTVMPASETAKPRSRSWSLSTPIVTPSGTTTFLSRMVSPITACRPTIVLCRITDRSTADQLLIRTPGESTDSRTSPPDTMTPLLTRLSIARPTRSPESCTNFAGGRLGTLVRIGHRALER